MPFLINQTGEIFQDELSAFKKRLGQRVKKAGDFPKQTCFSKISVCFSKKQARKTQKLAEISKKQAEKMKILAEISKKQAEKMKILAEIFEK